LNSLLKLVFNSLNFKIIFLQINQFAKTAKETNLKQRIINKFETLSTKKIELTLLNSILITTTMDIEKIKIDFREYLIENGKSVRTANRYSSDYIERIEEKLIQRHPSGLLSSFSMFYHGQPAIQSIEHETADSLLGLKLMFRSFFLNECLNVEESNEKKWKDYLSAIMSLIDFLGWENITKIQRIAEGIDYNPSRIELSKNELKLIFRNRLKTQDRNYHGIPFHFPAKILSVKKFYAHHYYFSEWINNQIDNIKIIINDKGESIQFKNISNLIFEKKYEQEWEVQCSTKTKSYTVFTRGTDNNSFRKFTTDNISLITLEHLKPFSKIISHKLKEGLIPTLNLVSERFRALENSDYKAKKINIKETILHDERTTRSIMNELKLIESEIELELMCSTTNKIRGNKN
jgi:hypothetical protein